MQRLFIPLLAVPALAACTAPTGDFPSLAPRPVEQRSDAEPAPPAIAPAPADPALAAQLAKILADARKGESDFAAALPAAERAVSAARGTGPSSDAWITAQSQLSALDSARAPTAGAMTEIDSLYVSLADRASQDAKLGGVADAAAVQSEVETMYNRQVERLAALRNGLSQP
ncbi:hypothetical protein [Sphingomonas colocasiae]|uniref:Uncharacterized protein n=1 Tax=Sphingomonas colocasiae TaxID=1848973 RepID=A0ABS7PKJ5_9SPHN|nr:hypothetical protein [Sphingomonas colocasiae]MBY8821812.1 hypothetical protein [Sphingomonas colocasiae]